MRGAMSTSSKGLSLQEAGNARAPRSRAITARAHVRDRVHAASSSLHRERASTHPLMLRDYSAWSISIGIHPEWDTLGHVYLGGDSSPFRAAGAKAGDRSTEQDFAL